MLRFFSLIAALSISSIPLFAQHMNEKDSPCADVVVTVDLARCLSKARDLADAELNALYKRIQATLDATEIQGLITAEHLWIQYRDANCIAERGLYGSGTASGPAHLASLEAMTRKRTKELAITYAVRLK